MVDEFAPGRDEIESGIQAYLREIGESALLTHEQEIELSKQILKGKEAARRRAKATTPRPDLDALEAAGIAARHQLAAANTRLVVSIAKRYHGMPLLDLIQEGNIGLMRAVEKFDHTKGHRFSTYATWWIRQAVTRAIADLSRTIRVPVHMNEAIGQLMRAEERFKQQHERPPTDEELATMLGFSEDKVAKILVAQRRTQMVSLDQPLSDDDDADPFGNIVPGEADVEEEGLDQSQYDELRRAIRLLSEREQRILGLRYGLDGGRRHTLEQIGQAIGMTRERVRQIEAEALRKLRDPQMSRGYAPASIDDGESRGDVRGRIIELPTSVDAPVEERQAA